jgi:hypothetical protein
MDCKCVRSTGTGVESEGQIETGKTRKRGRSLKTKIVGFCGEEGDVV